MPAPGARLIEASLLPLFPSSFGLPGLDTMDVRGFLRDLHRDTTALVWWGLVIAALAYQLAPLLTVQRPVPAAWLGPSLADRHANTAATSSIYPLKQATFLLKTFGGLLWGAHPDVRRRLGMAPLPPDPDTWRTT